MNEDRKSRFIKKSSNSMDDTKIDANVLPVNTTSMTSATSTSNTVLEGINCGICFETYSKIKKAPITLNCGHSFCRICVLKLGKGKVRITCGICRADTRCVAKRLGKNFQLIDMLEKLNLLQNDEDISDEVSNLANDDDIQTDNDNSNHENPQEDNIRASFEPAENIFDSLRNRLESLQLRINARAVHSEETYVFPRMQDRYDMIKEDVEHLEEKLEELRDECENVNMEVNNLCEDLNDTNSNQNQRRSRLSRFRLDRQARNLFAPIFRFGQGGMRSYGRGRSTSLSSDEGFIFGRINTPQNQINIVFNGPSNDGRIQINDSSNDFEELPDYTDISPNWASSPEPQQNVDHDSNYILRNYHTNANGRVMARCYLCDVVFYDDENAIRTHCRGARHRELSHLNRESNLQVFAELEDRSDTPVAQTFQPDPILNFFDDITEPLSNNMSVVNNNRPMEQDSNNYQPIIQINNEPIIRINDPNSYIRNRRGIRHSAHQPFRNTFQSEYRPNVQEELVNNRYSNFNSNENRNSTPNWHGMQRQGNSRHDRIWNNDNGHRRIVWGNNRENSRRRGRNHRLGTTNSNDPNISTNSSSSSTSIGLQHPSEEIWDSPWIEPTDTTTNNLSNRNSLAGRQQSNITHNRNTNSNHHYLGQTNASMNNAQPNMNKSHNKNVHSNGASTWYPNWNPTLQSNHQTNNSGNGHHLLDLLTSAELEPSSSQGQPSNNLRAKSNRPTGNQNEHQSNPSNSHNTTASNQSDRSFMQRRGGSNARGRGNEKSSWSIWE